MKVWRSLLCTAVTVIAFCASQASAATIALRTGVDDTNVVLSPGSLDNHWSISLDGGATFHAAKVLYPLQDPGNYLSGGQICCGMETVANTAAWISDQSVLPTNGNTSWGSGNLVRLKRSFDLTGYDADSVSLTGAWRIADYTMGVFLNGTMLPGTNLGTGSATWIDDHALNIAAGGNHFVSGINTIEFLGQSVNSGWDGLWFAGTIEGTLAPVPEPQVYVLALIGLGLIALRRRSIFARNV